MLHLHDRRGVLIFLKVLYNGKSGSIPLSLDQIADIGKAPKKRQTKAPAGVKDKKPARQSKLAKEHNISAAEELEIKEAFSLFAAPHPDYPSVKEGAIPSTTVRRVLTALGTPPNSPEELQELLEAVDPDESGYVPYDHFVAIAALKLNNRTEDDRQEEIEAAFNLFVGKEGTERITLAALRRVARELKEDVDEQLLKDMINEANGGSGLQQGVDLEEFEAVMKRAGVF